MKYVILHADGLTDVPRPDLDGRTPLQTAATPNLDRIAQCGEFGQIVVPNEGHQSGSEMTGMALLGYDPRKYYTGPAPLEAASLGVSVGEHDVVFRCTMVTFGGDSPSNGLNRDFDVKKLGPHVVMEDATAGSIETEQARELIDVMNEQLGSETIQFYPGSGHRHLMVWVGGKARSVCADPQQVVGRAVGEYLPAGDGADTLRKLMEASLVILRDHPVNDERRAEGLNPANCFWLWGQGRAVEWPSIAERYSLTGAVIAASEAHQGIGICAGLNVVDLSAEQETHASPYGAYPVSLERELHRRDVIYIHAGLSDDVRHHRDVKHKVEAIERFDRELVGPLLRIVETREAFRLVVACDPGPSVGREQASGPLLYALCEGPLHVRTAGKQFNEADAVSDGTPARDATKLTAKFLSRGA